MSERNSLGFCARALVLLFLPLLCRTPLQAQQGNVIELDHADSLVGLIMNGEPARQLIGDVRFHQGNMVVRCRRAIQFRESNKVLLEGEAEFWDGRMRMVTDSGIYYGDTKIAEAFNRVMVEESTTTVKARYGRYFSDEKKAFFKTDVSVEDTASRMTCNELTYYRHELKSIAIGDVKISNLRNGLTITGEHFENYRRQKYSKMTDHAVLMQIDTAGEGAHDTLLVRSKSMEAYQDSIERLVATDSVTITRGGLAAEAGIIVFYTELDSMILRKSPFIWYNTAPSEENQLSGDSIFIKLKNRKLETAWVMGNAFAVSRADSVHAKRFNQLTGQEIVMRFLGNRIRSIDVDRRATSLYYLFEEGKGNGANKATGDHVTILFENGKIESIKVIGGTEGQYFPERLIANKEGDYNLTGFLWRERRK